MRTRAQTSFEDHLFVFQSKFNDRVLRKRAYLLSDIFSKLNRLNLTLQNSEVTIFQVTNKIEFYNLEDRVKI